MNLQMNVLSIDIESWVHKYFLSQDSSIKKTRDNGYIFNATKDILNILKQSNMETTFFIVGEIFDWYPELIYAIKRGGHEIGFHTYSHRKLVTKKCLSDELKKGNKFIEEFDIKGFRAPEAIIHKEHLLILRDWGFSYDSSIYSEFEIFEPIERFLEAPVSSYPMYGSIRDIQFPRNLTFSLLLREIPFGSGYFIGLLGSHIQWFIKRCNSKNIPVSLVIHPWQIKNIPPETRNLEGNIVNRIKMIPYNINRRVAFEYLCKNYSFIPLKNHILTHGYK